MSGRAPKRYSIEWTGIATRETGWDEIEADTPDEARERWQKLHGHDRRVRAVSEIESES